MDNQSIVIRGAREHNLRSVDLELPRDQLIVFTGVSGSGKSSLAFDTLYAEGQRRYVESLSSYARQFLGELQKPDVDYLGGLEQLAADLGNLRYDSLAQFLHLFSQKIKQDGNADLGRNRPKLAVHLHAAADEIARAWHLCKPFMPEAASE